jgi:hypothetical protein
METSSDKMIIRIITYTTDVYIHFNRMIGMNMNTDEGGDQVLVTTRKTGVGDVGLSIQICAEMKPNQLIFQ